MHTWGKWAQQNIATPHYIVRKGRRYISSRRVASWRDTALALPTMRVGQEVPLVTASWMGAALELLGIRGHVSPATLC